MYQWAKDRRGRRSRVEKRGLLFSAVSLLAVFTLTITPLSPQLAAADDLAADSNLNSSSEGLEVTSSRDSELSGDLTHDLSGQDQPSGVSGEAPSDEDLNNGEGLDHSSSLQSSSARTSGQARNGDNAEFLGLTKMVDGQSHQVLKPGDTFTYSYQISVSQQPFAGIVMEDVLPDLSGFELIIPDDSVEGITALGDYDYQVQWSNGDAEYTDAPDILTAGDGFTMVVNSQIPAGETVTFTMQVKVPETFSPNDVRNAVNLINEASVSHPNAATVDSEATIVVQAQVKPGAAITKTWLDENQNAQQTFGPGALSTINLVATNKWNVDIDRLVVTENSAETFANFDFVGIGGVTLPEGADLVQVDVWDGSDWIIGDPAETAALPTEIDAGEVRGLRFTFTSTEGTRIAPGAAADISLNMEQRATPRDGSADLSLGYTANNTAQVDAYLGEENPASDQASATFKVNPVSVGVDVNKSFDPAEVGKGTTSTGTITVTNGSAPVNQLTVEDQVGFFDGTQQEGDNTWVRQFDGFSQGIAYPEGATTGTVTFTFDSDPACELEFDDGDVPSVADCVPSRTNAEVTGFKFVFTSDEGTNGIVGGANTAINFDVKTNGDATGANTAGYTSLDDQATFQGWKKTNYANASAEALNRAPVVDETQAELRVIDPWIHVEQTKKVRPSTAVLPGQNVIAELVTEAQTSPGTYITDLVITDQWRPQDGTAECDAATDFWDAFNITSVRPTQVHDGYTLTAYYKTTGTGDNAADWIQLGNQQAGPGYFMLDEGLFATAVGGDASAVTGVKFVYEYTGETTDPVVVAESDMTVTPHLGFTARTNLRTQVDGGNCDLPVTEPGEQLTFYNQSLVDGTGKTPETDQTVTDDATAVGPGYVVNPDRTDVDPGNYLEKEWDRDWVLELSRDDQRSTDLRWGVQPGFKQVVIGDPTDQESVPTVSGTVFDAFNLIGISGIAANSTPFTNGWYLKYDTIKTIELYYADAVDGVTGWTEVDGWTHDATTGAFSGLGLSPDQQVGTTAVRITLVPNDDARTAALTSGSDPFAPEPDTGIASSGGSANSLTNRLFNLTWQLRDLTRSTIDDEQKWVTRKQKFNTGEDGQVRNDVELTATPISGDTATRLEADDPILILGSDPALTLTKSVTPTSVVVPDPAAGIDAGVYPTAQYTVTAQNVAGQFEGGEGTSLAQWVRIVDPNSKLPDSVISRADPNENPWESVIPDLNDGLFSSDKILGPFNWQNITSLTVSASKDEVDGNASKVFLLYFKDGSFKTGAAILDAASGTVTPGEGYTFADVVGFSAMFYSKSTSDLPAGGGGMISNGNELSVTVDTQVRTTYRVPADGKTKVDPTSPVTTKNWASGQLLRADGKGKTGDAWAELKLTGEKLDVVPTKTITPGTVAEPDRDEPILVSLKANQGSKVDASSPKQVVLEDYQESAEFWGVVNLESIDSITFPEGADRVQIDVHVRGADATTWETGTLQGSTATEWALPTSVDKADVDGLRFTFTKADGKVFSPTNDPTWSAEVKLTFNLNDDAEFPSGPFDNKLFAQSFGVSAKSEQKFDSDDLNLTPGTHEIAVGKLTNNGFRQVKGGSTVPWDLVVENVGTGYIDLTKVVDEYPVDLLYTGTRPGGGIGYEFTDLAGGAISAPTVDASEAVNGKVTFDWSEAENTRLRPGQKVQIRLWLQLQPSAGIPDDNGKIRKIVNDFVVETENELGPDAVSRYEFFNSAGKPIGQPENAEAAGENGGESWDNISVANELAVQITKGVRGPESGFVSGAVNWDDPTVDCPTFLANDGTPFYQHPCVANSQQGEVDDWVLSIGNAGTTQYFDSFWVVDALSKPGDLLLVDGESRGSQFRPVLTGAPKVVPNQVMADATYDWREHVSLQVTTSDVTVCQGAWAVMKDVDDSHDAPFPGPCAQNGEVWETVTYDAEGDGSFPGDWEDVTGVRIWFHDYNSETGQHNTQFGRGWVADVTYSTRNVIKSDPSLPQGAQNVIPVDRDELAWNQFGVAFLSGKDGGANDRLASETVGTRLLNGSIQVAKLVEGDSSQYAPETFTATVTCEAPGVNGADATPLYFADSTVEGGVADSKTVELTKNSTTGLYTSARIHGIPVGAECTVVEDGNLGHFGEAERSPASQTLTVSEPDTEFGDDGLPTNDVPEAQISTITNTYNWGGLSVTKNVVTEADKGTFGPFDFELTCVTSDQSRTDGEGNVVPVPVEFENGEDTISFTLADGETWTAPEGTIPWGSTCTLTETNGDGAGSTVITGDNVTDNEDGSAIIRVTGTEDDPAAVVSSDVANHFAAGTLLVSKAVEGDGAETYGQGEFGFTASCVYKGDELIAKADQSFFLAHGDTKSFGTFPVGTDCVIKETATGNATETTLNPEDGKVTIEGPTEIEGEETPPVGNVEVSATNRFDVGSLQVNKIRTGAGAEQYGAGPFEAQVSCFYDRDGVPTDIELPNDGRLVLSEANEYSATIENLLVGAECSVVETNEDGAHSSELTPNGGVVTIGESEQVVSVDITNTFDVGSVRIKKTVDGPAAMYGVGPFEAQLACSYKVDGEIRQVALENDGIAVLSDENGYQAQFDGIYVGADCVVEETEVAGAHVSAISPNDGLVTVTESEQVVEVEITNTFNTGEVSVTKQVSTAADKGTFGPFDFELSCVTTQEQTVLFPDGEGKKSDIAKFTLGRDETWNAPTNTIPIGSVCDLREVNGGGAKGTAITGDNLVDNQDGSATFVVKGNDAVTAVISTLVDNHFDAGTLLVEKKVNGAGADKFGAGPFEFSAVCTYNEEKILDEAFTLMRDETKSFGVFPVGTDCVVEETDAGAAHESSLNVEGGAVVIAGPAEGSEDVVGTVTVTATNTFNTGSLAINKIVDGEGAKSRGAGPFTVETTCTYQEGGKTIPVELENRGIVQLTADNMYSARYDDIYAGADCVVVETDNGGAEKTTMDPKDGKITAEEGEVVTVTITNTFDKTPNLSKTGANIVAALIGAVLLLAAGGFALMRSTRGRGTRGR